MLSEKPTFVGGPLEDGRASGVHALHVYMAGDGMRSIGYYVQKEDGVFKWEPETLYDQEPSDKPHTWGIPND